MFKFIKVWWLNKNLSLLEKDLEALQIFRLDGESNWYESDLHLLDLQIDQLKLEITEVQYSIYRLEKNFR